MYASASGIGLALGLVQVGIVTRFLDPSEYGRAGLLLLFASLLTIAYNLGTLNGTFMRAFGSTGDEDVDDDQAHIGEESKREALGTGIVTTLIIALAGTLVVLPMAPTVARLLLSDESSSQLVPLAVAAGGDEEHCGASQRNIPRLEIRPAVFVVLSVLRPVLVIGAVGVLVATGHGVGGVVGGTALGSGAAKRYRRRGLQAQLRPSVLLRGRFGDPAGAAFPTFRSSCRSGSFSTATYSRCRVSHRTPTSASTNWLVGSAPSPHTPRPPSSRLGFPCAAQRPTQMPRRSTA